MRAALVLCALGEALTASAQNLVPNHSFEEYTTCPQTAAEVSKAVGWYPLYASPDYYNACATNNVVGVPWNTCGWQQAADGNAYMGLITYFDGKPLPNREFIGVQLIQPLTPGVPVCLSFKMAMGGFGSSPINSAWFTCNRVGIHFFNQWPDNWQDDYFYPDYPGHAALSMLQLPTDTALWYTVSGTYTPDSAYSLLAIGNFFPFDSLEVMAIDSVYSLTNWSYAYVDDVHVDYEGDCSSIGQQMTSRKAEWSFGPIPCENELLIHPPDGFGEGFSIKVFDMCGRLVKQATGRGNVMVRLPVQDLPPGLYSLNITSGIAVEASRCILHQTINTPEP